MIEGYPVVVAHIVQLMTYSRKQPSACLYCTDIPDIRLPLDIIIFQALFEDAQIKNGIMRYDAVRLTYMILFPAISAEMWHIPYSILADTCEPGIEIIKMRFRID